MAPWCRRCYCCSGSGRGLIESRCSSRDLLRRILLLHVDPDSSCTPTSSLTLSNSHGAFNVEGW